MTKIKKIPAKELKQLEERIRCWQKILHLQSVHLTINFVENVTFHVKSNCSIVANSIAMNIDKENWEFSDKECFLPVNLERLALMDLIEFILRPYFGHLNLKPRSKSIMWTLCSTLTDALMTLSQDMTTQELEELDLITGLHAMDGNVHKNQNPIPSEKFLVDRAKLWKKILRIGHHIRLSFDPEFIRSDENTSLDMTVGMCRSTDFENNAYIFLNREVDTSQILTNATPNLNKTIIHELNHLTFKRFEILVGVSSETNNALHEVIDRFAKIMYCLTRDMTNDQLSKHTNYCYWNHRNCDYYDI